MPGFPAFVVHRVECTSGVRGSLSGRARQSELPPKTRHWPALKAPCAAPLRLSVDLARRRACWPEALVLSVPAKFGVVERPTSAGSGKSQGRAGIRPSGRPSAACVGDSADADPNPYAPICPRCAAPSGIPTSDRSEPLVRRVFRDRPRLGRPSRREPRRAAPDRRPPGSAAASSAAFSPLPTPTVATGTPFGIWTIASSASRPSATPPGIATPITGSVVCEATTPGRCAASPAIAMNTPIPRSGRPGDEPRRAGPAPGGRRSPGSRSRPRARRAPPPPARRPRCRIGCRR